MEEERQEPEGKAAAHAQPSDEEKEIATYGGLLQLRGKAIRG